MVAALDIPEVQSAYQEWKTARKQALNAIADANRAKQRYFQTVEEHYDPSFDQYIRTHLNGGD
jgi:transposase